MKNLLIFAAGVVAGVTIVNMMNKDTDTSPGPGGPGPGSGGSPPPNPGAPNPSNLHDGSSQTSQLMNS